jgi:hypothetical protein
LIQLAIERQPTSDRLTNWWIEDIIGGWPWL